MTTVVLTPTLGGHDGLSCLSRQVVQALASTQPSVDVLVLANARPSTTLRAGGGGHTWPSHVTIADAHGRRSEFVWRALQLARRSSAPSLVVVLHAHFLSSAWPLVRRGAMLLPVLVGIEAWRPFSWAQKRMVANAHRAVAISHHTAREFKRANPVLSSLAVDVCWPATPTLAPPSPPTSARRRYALIVARMSAEDRYKGHDLLIDMWPEIMKAAPGAQLVVAGTGDDVTRLQQRVRDAGLDYAIEFVGPQAPPELTALYRDAAFLVMPSRNEGFGLVFLEAMSVGRACIGAPGSAQEIIVDGETGLIADPSRPHEVRDAVVKLFQQPDLAGRMGLAGERRAREVFSMERYTRELAAIVDRVLPARAAAAC
jgi:glycosyltransferase involved in cell wall biosynthesis